MQQNATREVKGKTMGSFGKHMRKVLTSLLAVCMVCSLSPASALAASTSYIDEQNKDINGTSSNVQYNDATKSATGSTAVRMTVYSDIQYIQGNSKVVVVGDPGDEFFHGASNDSLVLYVEGGAPWMDNGKPTYTFSDVVRTPSAEDKGGAANGKVEIAEISNEEKQQLAEKGMNADRAVKAVVPLSGDLFVPGTTYTYSFKATDSEGNSTPDVEFSVYAGNYVAETLLTNPAGGITPALVAAVKGTFLGSANTGVVVANLEVSKASGADYTKWNDQAKKKAEFGVQDYKVDINPIDNAASKLPNILKVTSALSDSQAASQGVDEVTLAVSADLENQIKQAQAEHKSYELKVVGLLSDGTPFLADVKDGLKFAEDGKSPAMVTFTPTNGLLGTFGVVYKIANEAAPQYNVTTQFKNGATTITGGTIHDASGKQVSASAKFYADDAPTLSFTAPSGYKIDSISLDPASAGTVSTNSVAFTGFTADVSITVNVSEVLASESYTVKIGDATNGYASFAEIKQPVNENQLTKETTVAYNETTKKHQTTLYLLPNTNYVVPDHIWLVPETALVGGNLPATMNDAWKVSLTSNSPIQTIDITGNSVIKVDFKEDSGGAVTKHTVTVKAQPAAQKDWGYISYGSDSMNNKDADLSFEIAPGPLGSLAIHAKEGYWVKSVTATIGNVTGDPVHKTEGTFGIDNVTADCQITVEFEPRRLTVSAPNTIANGSVTAVTINGTPANVADLQSSSGLAVDYGQKVAITLKPNANNDLLSVTVNGEAKTVGNGITKNADGTYTVEFTATADSTSVVPEFASNQHWNDTVYAYASVKAEGAGAVTPSTTGDELIKIAVTETKDEAGKVTSRSGAVTLNMTPSASGVAVVGANIVTSTGKTYTVDSIKGKLKWDFNIADYGNGLDPVYYITVKFDKGTTTDPTVDPNKKATLSVSSNNGGTVTPNGKLEGVYQGAEQAFSIDPAVGKAVGQIMITQNGTTKNALTQSDPNYSYDPDAKVLKFTPVADNASIVVMFVDAAVDEEETYTVTSSVITLDASGSQVASPVGGSVSMAVTSNIAYGSKLPVSLPAEDGYELVGFTVNGVDWPFANNAAEIVVTCDTALVATFQAKSGSSATETMDVTASVENVDGQVPGTVSPNSTAVTKGAKSAVEIKPNNGYRFTGLTVEHDGVTTQVDAISSLIVKEGNTYIYTVPGAYTQNGNVHVTAKFVADATSTPEDPDKTWNLTTYWRTVDESGNAIDGESYVSPKFEVTTKDGWNISTTAVKDGGQQTFSFITMPDAQYDYKVKSVSLDGKTDIQNVGASYTFFTVNNNASLYVMFERVARGQGDNDAKKTISASASAGGSINPSGDTEVTYGSSLTFEMVPSDRYMLSYIEVDGKQIPASALEGNTYTFTNITDNHAISAMFKMKSDDSKVYTTYVVQAGEGGTVDPAGTFHVDKAMGSQKATVVANYGWEIADIRLISPEGANVLGATSNFGNSYSVDCTFRGDGTYRIVASFKRAANTPEDVKTTTMHVSVADSADGVVHGTVSPSGSVPAEVGKDYTFGLFPAAGYVPTSILIDGVESISKMSSSAEGYSITVPVTDGMQVSVAFGKGQTAVTSPAYFRVMATSAGFGKITPQLATVGKGGTVSMFMQPDDGYQLSTLKVGGKDVTDSVVAGTYSATFTDQFIAEHGLKNGDVLAAYATFVNKETGSTDVQNGEDPYVSVVVDVKVDVDVNVGIGAEGVISGIIEPMSQTVKSNSDVPSERDAHFTAYPEDGTILKSVLAKQYDQDMNLIRSDYVYVAPNMQTPPITRALPGQTEETQQISARSDTYMDYPTWTVTNPTHYTVLVPTYEKAPQVKYHGYYTGKATWTGNGIVNPSFMRWQANEAAPIDTFTIQPLDGDKLMQLDVDGKLYTQADLDKIAAGGASGASGGAASGGAASGGAGGASGSELHYDSASGMWLLHHTFAADFNIRATFSGTISDLRQYTVSLASDEHGFLGDDDGISLEESDHSEITLTATASNPEVSTVLFDYPDEGYTLKGFDASSGIKVTSVKIRDAKKSAGEREVAKSDSGVAKAYAADSGTGEKHRVLLTATSSGTVKANHVLTGSSGGNQGGNQGGSSGDSSSGNQGGNSGGSQGGNQGGNQMPGQTEKVWITPSAGAHGGISPDEPWQVIKGDNKITFQFKPDIGYVVKSVKVNGTEFLYNQRSYSLSDIKEDTTVHVEFEAAPVAGDQSPTARTLRTLTSLAQTGDLNLPIILGLMTIGCGALGLAILLNGRRKNTPKHMS